MTKIKEFSHEGLMSIITIGIFFVLFKNYDLPYPEYADITFSIFIAVFVAMLVSFCVEGGGPHAACIVTFIVACLVSATAFGKASFDGHIEVCIFFIAIAFVAASSIWSILKDYQRRGGTRTERNKMAITWLLEFVIITGSVLLLI